jgi:hypothetical protein
VTKSSTQEPATTLQEVAYHHEPYWLAGEGNWIKSLLLFFEGVAVLVPDYMRDRPLISDPTLAQPLDDLGLLHRLSPEELVDQPTTRALTDLLDRLIREGAFDNLDRDSGFAELSYSRLGGHVAEQLTDSVLDQLQQKGLARPSEDGVSVPLHPAVRSFVLVVLPQLLRAPAEAAGYALQPASTQPRALRALLDALNLSPLPTAGNVVAFDLEQVTLDLSSIPLDEVLEFRREHGPEHRAYARDLRKFVRDLASLDPAAGDEAFLQVDEDVAGGGLRRGIGNRVVEQAQGSFEQAVGRVQPAVQALLARLRELADTPEEVQVEFGLQLSAEAGAFVAAASSTGNFRVTMTWRSSPGPVQADDHAGGTDA